MKRGVDRREKKSLNMNVGSETELPDFLVTNGQKFHKKCQNQNVCQRKIGKLAKIFVNLAIFGRIIGTSGNTVNMNAKSQQGDQVWLFYSQVAIFQTLWLLKFSFVYWALAIFYQRFWLLKICSHYEM